MPLVASARPNYHCPQSPGAGRRPTLSIRFGQTLDEAGTQLAPNAEGFLRGETEMRRLFRDHEGWVDASSTIAERCEFDFEELRLSLSCELPPGQTADERLAALTWEGARHHFPPGSPQTHCTAGKELELIKNWKLPRISCRRSRWSRWRGAANPLSGSRERRQQRRLLHARHHRRRPFAARSACSSAS